MRITTKLRIVSTSTIVALVVMAPILIWSFIEFTQAKNNYGLAEAIKANFFERISFSDQYFLYREDSARENWDKNKKTAEQMLSYAGIQFHDEAERQILARLQQNIGDSAAIFHRIVDNTKVLKTADGNRHVYEELDKRLFSQLLLKAVAIRDLATELKDESARHVEQTYKHLSIAISLIAFSLALGIFLVAVHLGRTIREKLHPIHEGAKHVAAGDLSYRVSEEGADEFAELAASINAMTDSLQNFTGKLKAEISERQRAEEILKESERRYQFLFESSPLPMWVVADRSLRFLMVNDRAIEHYGYTREEFGRMTLRDIRPLEDIAELERVISSTPNRSVAGEWRHKKKDGSIIDVAIHSVPMVEGGSPARIVTVQDITERKRQERKILENEQSLLNILNASPIAVRIAVNRGHDVVFWNPRYAELINSDNAMHDDPQRYYAHTQDYEEILHELAQGKVIIDHPIELRIPDGSTVWALASYMPMQYQGKEAVLGWFYDITGLRLTEQELKRSNAELEQFSYAISHDMRQPLRMISSYLQLIQMSLADKLDETNREYFKYAVDGAKRLDQMLLGLLDYSRVGRKSDPFIWVESRKLLDEALLFLGPAIAEAQADLSVEGDWPRVRVSRDEIMRLLQNLIGNALKYRLAGRTQQVRITSQVAGKHWRLCVADNGVGIDPKQIGRLFQIFQRLQARSSYEGTGIGLALCRRIVEHHDGRIWVESAGADLGSAFYVELPMAEA